MRSAANLAGRLVSSQLSIDPRTLGAARIALGTLLLFDLWKRTLDLATWYGNSGLLPNHTLLARPVRAWHPSFLWSFSHRQEVAVVFALIAIVYLALLLGYRTRLAHALSLVCLISLHVRVDLLCNGGDFAFCALMWWTAFLPMGTRFSVDAVAESLRRGPETPMDLRSPPARPRDTAPVVSLAVLGALGQFAVIYFFNAIQKTGPTWMEGSAIHYLVQQERILTPVGLLAREHLPYVVTQALSWATLAVEGALPLLILSPIGRPWTRRVALLLVLGLHGGIALLVNVGVFSPVMFVFGMLLVSSADWDALEAWAARRREKGAPFHDAISGVFELARTLVERPLAALARRRASISDGLVHAVPGDARAGGRRCVWLREAAVLFLIFIALAQVLHENWIVPEPIGIRSLPRWIQASISYTRLQQGWSMFAPDAPRSEVNVVVDAMTASGRSVDPIRAAASGSERVELEQIVVQPGYDVFWVDYVARIESHRAYHDALRDWIMTYHRRTGNPGDRVRSFVAVVIEQDSPPPGEEEPRNVRRRPFLSGPARRR